VAAPLGPPYVGRARRRTILVPGLPMRVLRSVRFVILLLVGATSARAQEQRREIDGIRMYGMPHPVSAAIAYWQVLGLTEEQVVALRRIASRAETALFGRYAAQMMDTTTRLQFWRSSPIDSVALFRAGLAALGPEVHLQLELLRARDEVFRVLSAAQRATLDSLVVRPTMAPPVPPRPTACTLGRSGGSLGLSEISTLIYSVGYHGDSATIGAVVVARADSTLEGLPGPATGAGPRDVRRFRGGGGSVGRWLITHDATLDAVWVDTMRVDLQGKNVVLLQGVDRVTRQPDVKAIVAVSPYVRTGGCRDRSFSDALREHVLASPDVQAFLRGRP